MNATLPQDRTLFHFLTQRLRPLLLDPADAPETVDQRRVLTARIEELELAALLLDILLATLQDSNCISDKIQARPALLWSRGFDDCSL